MSVMQIRGAVSLLYGSLVCLHPLHAAVAQSIGVGLNWHWSSAHHWVWWEPLMPLRRSLVLMTITWHQDQLCFFFCCFVSSVGTWFYQFIMNNLCSFFDSGICSSAHASLVHVAHLEWWHGSCIRSAFIVEKRQSALVCNGTAILETCLHVMCSNVCACVRWMLKCWYLCCICVFEYLLKHSVEPTQSSLFHFKAHFLYWG